MRLHPLDWFFVVAYVVFALWVGFRFSRRAGKDVDEFFLSGRSLPWWIAGTSMVATTFAADTPLVVTGWVRDHGIWKNWLWWCFAAGGMLTVFLFARYWRRGEVMTTAELSELRYGGSGARVLRGFLGFYHAGITNTIVLCWVLLAAAKIMDALFEVDRVAAVSAACALALVYSLLAGFWGVVLTDLLQFAMAMVGAIVLAALAWSAVGGIGELRVALAALAEPERVEAWLALVPKPGPGSLFDASFWTAPVAALAVYLGIAWWAKDGVDGGAVVVQRISASRNERDGVLAALWFQIANYGLRPWPWILVALASLAILPHMEVRSPVTGVVAEVGADYALIATADGGPQQRVEWDGSGDWHPAPSVSATQEVSSGDVVAITDSELAYPVMMARFLPIGMLGLVIASLLAAFMSTIDTHVNLAASFFVNDIYRRFLVPDAKPRHYVLAARVASVVVMLCAGLMAINASSIGDLFTFFLAFLGGVGPVYVLRWCWWRIRASTEITAMLASSLSTTWLTLHNTGWSLGALSPDGVLTDGGRLCLVVAISAGAALLSLLFTKRPDPTTLVPFYRKVRPLGWWGPVRELAPDVVPSEEALPVGVGVVAGLAAVYGSMFGLGLLLLGRPGAAAVALGVTIVGAFGLTWALGRLEPRSRGESSAP